MFRTVWDLYIKFYTVFLTFSLAAMSWLIEHKITSSHSHKVIAVVFIGQSLLTSITSGAIGIYSYTVGKQLSGVEIALLAGIHLPAALKRMQTIPSGLGLWSGFANAAAMIGMACVLVLGWVQNIGRVPHLSRSLRKVGFHERKSIEILILYMGVKVPILFDFAQSLP